MYEIGFYVPFNSISVTSGQWKGEHERLFAMKHCFINSILIYIFIHNLILYFLFIYLFIYLLLFVISLNLFRESELFENGVC